MFDVEVDPLANLPSRPDIPIINKSNREVFLVEVAVPFDDHIDQCCAGKVQKYTPLCLEIKNFGFICRIVVVVSGSLGTAHSRVVSGFRLLGIPRYSTKWLARQLSASAATSSFRRGAKT